MHHRLSILRYLVFVPLIFGFPNLKVNWSGGEFNSVRITAEGKERLINQCIESGLEVRYRYEFRVCKRRFFWADSCEDDVVRVRSLQFDPISESYRVFFDIIGDREPAKIVTHTSLDEALQDVTTLVSPSLAELGFNEKKYPPARAPYLGVRVITDCKGDYSETFARISSVLTLGLVDVGTFDSGWVDFSLSR